jgi:hypothetical protein
MRHRVAAGRILVAAAAVAVTLAGTATPALAVNLGQQAAGRPALAYSAGTMYVAWTGTDSQNHVNVGGVSFTNNADNLHLATAVMVNDTAILGTGPALGVATLPGTTGDQLLVAWAGTDSAHHIWMGHYNGSGNLDCHTQLSQATTLDSPYLIGVGSNVYVAWTGMDNHVNIGLLNTNSCPSRITLQTVVTLTDTAIRGPAITTYNGSLYVAWPGTDAEKHIYMGRFTGGPALANHTCLCSLASINDLGMSSNAAGAVTITYEGTDGRVYLAHLKNGTTLYDNQTDGANKTNSGGDIADIAVGNGNYPGGQYNTFNGTDDGLNLDHHVYALPPA